LFGRKPSKRYFSEIRRLTAFKLKQQEIFLTEIARLDRLRVDLFRIDV